MLLENPLTVTLIIVLVGILPSGYLKGRAKDRCLQGFSGYHVTLPSAHRVILSTT